MSNREIGAFEAKTHFSQLLKEVEKGNVIHVTRRGKPVAVLAPESFYREQTGQKALKRIAKRRNMISKRVNITTEELLMFRDEGRR
jgi:prevent-host-death family protein